MRDKVMSHLLPIEVNEQAWLVQCSSQFAADMNILQENKQLGAAHVIARDTYLSILLCWTPRQADLVTCCADKPASIHWF